jgi:hypothetical protein
MDLEEQNHKLLMPRLKAIEVLELPPTEKFTAQFAAIIQSFTETYGVQAFAEAGAEISGILATISRSTI